jgi:hypothetical protein
LTVQEAAYAHEIFHVAAEDEIGGRLAAEGRCLVRAPYPGVGLFRARRLQQTVDFS